MILRFQILRSCEEELFETIRVLMRRRDRPSAGKTHCRREFDEIRGVCLQRAQSDVAELSRRPRVETVGTAVNDMNGSSRRPFYSGMLLLFFLLHVAHDQQHAFVT